MTIYIINFEELETLLSEEKAHSGEVAEELRASERDHKEALEAFAAKNEHLEYLESKLKKAQSERREALGDAVNQPLEHDPLHRLCMNVALRIQHLATLHLLQASSLCFSNLKVSNNQNADPWSACDCSPGYHSTNFHPRYKKYSFWSCQHNGKRRSWWKRSQGWSRHLWLRHLWYLWLSQRWLSLQRMSLQRFATGFQAKLRRVRLQRLSLQRLSLQRLSLQRSSLKRFSQSRPSRSRRS